jgi:hypothetical protein
MTKAASNGGLRCLSSQKMNVIPTTKGRKDPGELPRNGFAKSPAKTPPQSQREPTYSPPPLPRASVFALAAANWSIVMRKYLCGLTGTF